MIHIFNEEQLKKANFIIGNPVLRLSFLLRNEIKDLACVWCYYSGKIEGNTYTYVETETLLKDGITSPKRYEEAAMLMNLYNTFVSELKYSQKNKNEEKIDERTLFRIHPSIISGLESDKDAGKLRNRPVRITGTLYVPPQTQDEIQSELGRIFFNRNNGRIRWNELSSCIATSRRSSHSSMGTSGLQE